MTKRNKRLLMWFLVPVLTMLVVAVQANASPITIDFRSPQFAPAYGLPSFSTTVSGINVSLLAGFGLLYWDSTDGLGITGVGYEFDEIEGQERLAVGLAFPQPLTITSFLVTDLFNEGYLETGFYSLDSGSTWIGFQANPGQVPGSTNGVLSVPVGQLGNALLFKAPGLVGCQNHEFSLAAITAEPVPEPHTATLFGIGGGLWFIARSCRRRKAAR